MPENFDPLEPLRNSSLEVKRIVQAVIKIEKERISQLRPRHILQDLKEKIEEIVK